MTRADNELEVGSKGGRNSEFVTDGFLTLVILTRLGQLTAHNPDTYPELQDDKRWT